MGVLVPLLRPLGSPVGLLVGLLGELGHWVPEVPLVEHTVLGVDLLGPVVLDHDVLVLRVVG